MKRVASVLVSLSFLIAICPAVADDLLPGWAMYFIDFEPGKDLDLKVTQRSPSGSPDDFEPATGIGCFAAEGRSGTLFVNQASWSNYSYYSGKDVGEYPDLGFPESAVATGSVRLGFFNWRDFEVELRSHEWPSPENMTELDEAILHIYGDSLSSITFRGQLHHSRLREWFAPARSDSRGTMTTTWGKIKNSR